MMKALPVLRMFDYPATLAFYMDWPGFILDWEHAPEGSSFYLQLSFRDTTLQFSHCGKCSPGALVILPDVADPAAYQEPLPAKDYPFMKPGLETAERDPGVATMTVIDPFFNCLRFTKRHG